MIAAVNGVAAGAGRRDRACRRPAATRALRDVRVPIHARGPVRRRHGRGLPAAADRRPRPRDRAARCWATRSTPTARAEIGLANEVVADEELPAAAGGARAAPGRRPGARHSTTKVLLTRELDSDARRRRSRWRRSTQALLMKSDDFREFYDGLDEGGARRGRAADRQSARAARADRLRARRRRGRQRSTSADRPARARRCVEQFDSAAAKLVTALRAAGGEPERLVSLVVYTTDIEDYRASTVRAGRGLAHGTSGGATPRWR